MHTQTLIHATNTISSHAWHRFCPNMLLMQHTIWASTLFGTCLRRTFCLHHADSDANTCNKYNFLTGMGSRRSSHHRFCSKHAVHATWQIGHLPSSVHASEEPFVCIMQVQMLMHATVLSRHWQQVFGLWRNSPDPKTKGWIPTRTKQELGKWSTTSSNKFPSTNSD